MLFELNVLADNSAVEDFDENSIQDNDEVNTEEKLFYHIFYIKFLIHFYK